MRRHGSLNAVSLSDDHIRLNVYSDTSTVLKPYYYACSRRKITENLYDVCERFLEPEFNEKQVVSCSAPIFMWHLRRFLLVMSLLKTREED
jgi:hypothetical protein